MALRDLKNKKRADLEDEKILDVDASMQGTLTFHDPVNLRINGKFEGTLDTKGNLIIAESANVEAQINGDNVTIAGRFKGKISASGKIALQSQSVVQGEIETKRLVVEDGAVFEGSCKMLQDIFNIEELAKYLDVETSSILEWINQDKIPVLRENGKLYFERKRIDDWIVSEKV